MKIPKSLLLLLGIPILLLSCAQQSSEKRFVIGFSQCVDADIWRQTMLEGMKRELAFHNNITFLYRQADNSSATQIKQVKELLNQKIDLLIISPNQAEPLTPIVQDIFNRGIPVIVIDRKVASTAYTAYIGADNYEVGKLAGEYAVNLLNKKGTVTEVVGLRGSSPAIERNKGFMDAIKDYPLIKVTKQINGEWLKEKAYAEVSKNADDVLKTDLVFAHNDMMARATKEALQEKDPTNHVRIIGIDALPGKGAGIEFVSEKKITASVLYPTGGEEAIRVALKILRKEEFQKENLLSTLVVDSTNVRLMKLQTDKISSQQLDIEKQQSILEEQIKIYNDQKTFSNILTGALLMVLLLGTAVFYSWKKNMQYTKLLKTQNEEILSQKNQLVEMSARAESAHQAKLNFFTNISHEFRTPLTLILAPIDELLENTKIQTGTRQTLTLIQRNVIRLFRLVNQLMDFRKIEFSKMKVKASENDLVSFTKEITDSYEVLARHKHIDLRFFTSERSLTTWFDVNMIDKVIFNLLSNAFKFTKENGFIQVTVSKSLNNAIITVEDNGIGISKEAIDHAFEPFFQGEYENYKGSGLGLALSKEFIEIHHGKINVSSEKWKGTKFELLLPLGNEHFKKEELVVEAEPGNVLELAKIFTTELLNTNEPMIAEDTTIDTSNRPCILLIEDNTDLLAYLKSRLTALYDVIEAENGNTAIQLCLENIPDLVISDVVIPGKNGLEVTRILKNDIRTSHIPVILLTARNDEKQILEGMQTQADAYITKPFNLQLLQQSINNLLANSNKIKGHYSSEVFVEERSQAAKKTDRKFISEFSAIIEKNLSNEKFGVDDICRGMGVSRIQLYRKVKAVLNCNVNDYIVNTRMQKAKYYIQHEDLSMAEIANRTGFSSAAYFSTVFKSKFDCTPSEYKLNKTS